MKSIKSIICSATMIAALSAYALTETVDGIKWTYTVSNGEASIGKGASSAIPQSTSGAVTTPSALGGYSVTSIGKYAFSGCSGLTSVAIPNSVTNIGASAFSGCSGLTSVAIPNSVTNIGASAFSGCSGLAEITLPFVGSRRGYVNKTESLFGHIFGTSPYKGGTATIQYYSSSSYITNYVPAALKRVIITDDTILNSYAFYGCSGLTSITIPSSVRSVGWYSFKNCSGLTGITIPVGVRSIGLCSFENCSGLTSITIPDSVTDISTSVFSGCSGLTSVIIPDSVTKIGVSAFSGCSGLTSVAIPNSVTNIGASAFSGCSGLTSMTLPFIGSRRGNFGTEDALFGYVFGTTSYAGGTKTKQYYSSSNYQYYYVPSALKTVVVADEMLVGYGAFYNCSGLMSITIPNGVMRIESSAFAGCSGLTSVAIPNSVTEIESSAFYGCSSLTSVTIPNSVARIGSSAFYNCSRLTNVVIPNGVQTISDSAFYNCSGLASVMIPNSVTRIYRHAFSGCSGLTSIVIPDSVTSIETSTFYGCSGLTSIVIPDSVTSIGTSAFSGCSRLRSATIPQYVCTESLSSVFPSSYKTMINVVMSDGVTNIGSEVFSGCSGLISVTIPEGVTNIGFSAFSGCSGLMSVTVPDGVISIGENAFSGCSALESITLPFVGSKRGNSKTADSVFGYIFGTSSYIGGQKITQCYDGPENSPSIAYYIPTTLRSVTITDESVLGYGAFYGCSGLTNVTIYSDLTSIGGYAFKNCAGIKEIRIPENVETIGMGAFSGSGIKGLTIPDNVAIIGNAAFNKCSLLEYIVLPPELTDLGRNDFRNIGKLSEGKIGLWVQDTWLMGYIGEAPSEVVVPEGVTGIASYAFEGQTGLARVGLPSTLKYIGANAFMGCTALEEIEIPNRVEKIDNGAFNNCTWLQDLTLPQNLKIVGKESFANCAMLQNLVCADGLETIGEQAFSNCWRMLSVSLPVSVTNVGDNAFIDCKRLSGVHVPAHINNFATLFPSAYSNISTVVVSDGEWMLTKDVFKGCKALSDIVLPSTITQMCASAFENCTALSAVDLPDGIESIGDGAFRGCVALEDVKLPRALKVICDSVFRGCTALARLDLPNMVEDIGAYAFYGDSRLADFNLPRSLKRVGNYAFFNCTMMAEACFADGLLYLGTNAYQNCTSVKVVYIPSSVTALGTSIFAGCASITNITTATAHQTMASLFPSVYNKLPRILIAPGENRLCASCFTNCTAMTEIGLPDSVTTMGESAFSGCTRLSRVSLSSRLAALPDYAFKNCTSLATLTIPESVASLGKNVFEGCSNVESLYFVGDAPTYNEAVFGGIASGVTVFVVNGSMGWDGVATSRALPDSWPTSNSREITYWEPNRFDVVFDANGGAPATNVLEEITGMTYTLPIVNPTMPGATFLGWWTEPVNGAQVTAGTQVTLTRAHTFYAHWAGNLYHVTFDANGGMGNMADQTYVVGEPTELPLNVFAKPGFAFVGWSLVPDGGLIFADGAIVENLTLESDATVTLYAVWDEQAWATGDYMNAPGRMFVSGGDAEWTNDVVICHDRIGSMRSGAIGQDGESSLSTTVVGAGVVSFWWKVSCEEAYKTDRYDYVTFSVDGVERDWIAGEVDWTNAVFEVIGSGPHILTWRYHKDDWDEPGYECEDCAWVDEFCWSPSAVTATFDGNGNTAGAVPKNVVKWEGYALTLPGVGTLEKFSFVFAGWSDGKGIYAPGTIYVFMDKDISFSAVWAEKVWTYADFLNSTNLLFTSSVGAEWVGDFVTNHDWVASMQSAAIGDGQSSWLQGTVTGCGTLSFWVKVSGETRRGRLYDYLCVTVDGEEVYSAADVDWTNVVIDITSPDTHMIRWTYLKDTSNSIGCDCAWIDEVRWLPNVDQIPAVANDADAATVNAMVNDVGFADEGVKAAIGGSVEEYTAFKTWAGSVKGATGDALAGEAAVVASPHAAAAYLLGAERLFANAPTVEIGEVSVGDGESAGTTAMSIAVTVKDGESVVAVNAAKVKAMFEATGDLGDWNGAAKLTPEVTVEDGEGATMRFKVTPGDGTAPRAFLRIRK